MIVKIPFLDLENIMNSGQIFRMYRVDDTYIIFSADKRLEISKVSSNEDFSEIVYGKSKTNLSEVKKNECEASSGKSLFGNNRTNIIDDNYFELSCDENEYYNYWIKYFDLETNYEAIYDTIDKNDNFLLNAANFGRGIRVLNQDLWEMIISFIISQQKRIPEIRKCIEKLCERLGEVKVSSITTWYTFPTARSIVEAGLDGLKGLSLGYRERYIYETAVKIMQDFGKEHFDKTKEANKFEKERSIKSYFTNLSFQEAKEYLKTFCGIGEKVANCICLFGLGYKDAFPIDVHIKDILHREYYHGKKEQKELSDAEYTKIVNTVFSKYNGYRGIIQQWIFFSEITKDK